jgi:hypothetical protein
MHWPCSDPCEFTWIQCCGYFPIFCVTCCTEHKVKGDVSFMLQSWPVFNFREQVDLVTTTSSGMTTILTRMSFSASRISCVTHMWGAHDLFPYLRLHTMHTSLHSGPATILLRKSMTGMYLGSALEKVIATQLDMKFPALCRLQRLLQCSQKPITSPYFEPLGSSSYICILFL